MKEVFVYLGVPGAGTERVQRLLENHADFLLEHDCLCPLAGRGAAAVAVHHNLALDLLEDVRYEPARGGLAEVVEEVGRSGNSKIILSSGLFLTLHRKPGALQRLKNAFASIDYQFRWMVYFRPYAEWMEANYIESLFLGNTTLSFDEWIPANHNFQIARPMVLLKGFFETGDPVLLRSYTRVSAHFARDLLDQWGIPHPEDLEDPDPVRKILPMDLNRMILKFSQLHPGHGGLSRLIGNAIKLSSNLPDSPPLAYLTRETRIQLESMSRANFEEVLAMAGVQSSYAEFFPPRKEDRKRDSLLGELSQQDDVAFHEVLLRCLLS